MIGIVTSSNFYLFVVFTIVALLGTVGFFFLKNPKKIVDKTNTENKVNVLETVLLFKDQTLLLLTPICIYSGLSQSLNFGSFTALIGNTVTIGYVMSLFGLADCLGSIFNGIISGKLGKRVVILTSSISAMIGFILTTVASQIENQGKYYEGYFYVSAIFLGYADSGFNTQIYSMLGSYYPKQSEAAFAAFKLLQAMSTSVAFFYSPYVGYPFLVLFCVFFLLLGLVFLVVLDIFVNPIDANLKKRTYMTDSDYAVSDTDIAE